MDSPTPDHTTQGPDFRSLRALVRAGIDELLARPDNRDELAALLPTIEDLHHEVQRAQLVAAQAADRAGIALIGAPGAGPRRPEYRSTADYLARTLRIGRAEARTRLEVAAAVLPARSLTGEPVAPRHRAAAAALDAGTLSLGTAALLVRALDRVRPAARQLPGGGHRELEAMEANLVATAGQAGPETVRKVAEVWELRLDQDGREPSEETKTQLQGLFDCGRRFGLRAFRLFMDDAQAERLLAAVSPAANPRTGPRPDPAAPGAACPGTGRDLNAMTLDGEAVPAPMDPRTRAQKLLDGLVGALGVALSTNRLPRNGGNRPQVMVTIDHQTLLDQLAPTAAGPSGAGPSGARRSEAVHGGTIHPRHVRRIACDADLIPVVLGGDGQVLDAGRAERLFTEDQRRILYARDRGCTAPGCAVPADGCEAHHVWWWSRGGPTDIDNGALACAFHHHLAHAGDWEIEVIRGVPYWIPPAHADPSRRPLRNTYFHPEPSHAPC